jgi:hypothetical protein
MDVERAAELYAQGWTLRQTGTELGVHWATVSQQLRKAGVTMRRSGPAAHPASTQKILDLRDQGLTWNQIAQQVGMTVSGAWSPLSKGPAAKVPHDWADGSRCSPTLSTKTLQSASEQVLISSVRPVPLQAAIGNPSQHLDLA